MKKWLILIAIVLLAFMFTSCTKVTDYPTILGDWEVVANPLGLNLDFTMSVYEQAGPTFSATATDVLISAGGISYASVITFQLTAGSQTFTFHGNFNDVCMSGFIRDGPASKGGIIVGYWTAFR